jgi:dienelactone hydrolase
MDCTEAEVLHRLFADYDRRFALAMARLPDHRPWQREARPEIRSVVRRCLGIRDEWRPAMTVRHRRRTCGQGFVVQHLRATSWAGVHTSAHLYLPAHTGMERMPAVLLCCGHGEGGKHAPSYQRMALHLVRLGAAVLVPDNIGQGERAAMGHGDAVVPFACGTSLQGLIVLEAMGWLDWLEQDSRIDASRVAAIGNSGGGTLTLFLGALREELAAVSSSGYPSTFEFVARKEKRHCLCNVLPGIVGRLEMWQLLGCVAPRPLLVAQGDRDTLFPSDLFHRVVRQTRTAYSRMGADAQFEAEFVPGEHSWDTNRCQLIGEFLARTLELPHDHVREPPPPLIPPEDTCFAAWPDAALDAGQLARQLTGRNVPDELRLWDVYPIPEEAHRLPSGTLRGDLRRILAQFEAFLANVGE